MPLRIFGLTGGLASGKSTVAARFEARGVPVIDADVLARECVAPGSPGLAAVVAEFGRDVLLADGTLDRRRLASLVFADEARRRALDALLHPRIQALVRERARALEARGETLACYDAALLVENGLAEAYRPLVVVDAPLDVRVERARLRDGASEASVRARIAAQMPLSEKVALADHVIDNGGDRAATLRRADQVLDAIRARIGG